MATINYLMKKKHGNIWDTYYPISTAENILTKDNLNVQKKLDTIYDKTATINENGAMSKEDKSLLLSIKKRIDDVLGPNASSGSFVPAIEAVDDRRYLRNDNTWQTITPLKIGAIPNTGGYVSGQYVFKGVEPSIAVSPNTGSGAWEQGINIYSYKNQVIGGIRIKGNNATVNNIGFYIDNSNVPVFNIESDRLLFKESDIYSKANKPTPNEIGALGVSDAASSAKKLTNAVLINGVSFDGSRDITIPITGGDISKDINFTHSNAKIKYKNSNLLSIYDGTLLHGVSLTSDGTIIVAHDTIDSTIRATVKPQDLGTYIGGINKIGFYTSANNAKNNKLITFTKDDDITGINGIKPLNELNYPALILKGSKNNYSSGLYFEDIGKYFIVNNTTETSGIFKDGTYEWGFTKGVLTNGSVPWTRLTNVPTSFTPSTHTHTDYIRKTNTVTGFYAGTSVPNNNDGKENGTVYLKYDK